ncbi:MAG TPA: NAD(P)/FAD-dependent oxidoreductase [candidate division Zixibacteria bacterium]
MPKKQVIVVGAGPAGLIAAGMAAKSGAKGMLLEKMQRPGIKLRLTGAGRCNLTNSTPLPDFIAHFGPGGRFLRQAFSQFFSSDLVEFLKELGIRTKTESEGRVFPASGKAGEVADALVDWAVNCGVNLLTEISVKRLIVEKGRVMGVEVFGNSSPGEKVKSRLHRLEREYSADAVIIACGGASYPSTGSSGDGYRLAESVGHTIIPVRPVLVPVKTEGDVASRLQGVSLSRVRVKVRIDAKKRTETAGELIFTHFGLSGPLILDLSKLMVDALRENQKVDLSLDFIPDMDESKLNGFLEDRLRECGKQKLQTSLKEFLPGKLISVCLDLARIPSNRVGNQVTAAERKRLCQWLKDFKLEVTGYLPLAEAMITAGGVDTKEVDPRTMESRLVRGLYFAGEVLDIDADTGGYNLQAAFSTGWVAGCSAG